MKSRSDLSCNGSQDLGPARLWTVSEVAEFLQLHAKTVYAMAAGGKLPCVRVGSHLRFDSRDIASWVSARKEG